MKKITLLIASVFCLTAITNSNAQSAELADHWNQNPTYTVSDNLDFSVANQGGLLYSNGPYFNQAGTPDLSIVENVTLGSIIFGAGHANSTGFRVADEWVLTDAVDVSSIDFYAYQTGSTTTSTIDFISLRIWDGDPSDPTSTVIYGDDTTNALSGTAWTGAYRVTEDAQTGTTRT
jgi:hypothetical protein